jgi:hypothetical protein
MFRKEEQTRINKIKYKKKKIERKKQRKYKNIEWYEYNTAITANSPRSTIHRTEVYWEQYLLQ